MADIKPGLETTEYEKSQQANVWSIIGLTLGALLSLGGMILPGLEEGSTAAIIVGACISVISIIQKALTDLGYIKSRTEVKTTAEIANRP